MCHVPNPSSPRHHSRRPYTTYRLIVRGVGEERPPLGQSADSGGGESRRRTDNDEDGDSSAPATLSSSTSTHRRPLDRRRSMGPLYASLSFSTAGMAEKRLGQQREIIHRKTVLTQPL